MLFRYITVENSYYLLHSPQFITATWNSFCVTIITTIISSLLSFTLAWFITHKNIVNGSLFKTLFTLPMLIPSMSLGMGFIILLGRNGIFNEIFGLKINIYGFWGIIIASVLYSFPVAFLMFLDVFQYEDRSSYEAADILGIPKSSQFIKITLPYLRRPIISVLFTVFTLVVTDYGVPLMIGGNFITLPVMMYQEVIGLLNFGTGAIIGVILLIPAIIAFLTDLLHKETVKCNLRINSSNYEHKHTIDIPPLLICIFVSILILLPILSIVILTFVTKYPIDMKFSFDNILQTFQLNGGRYYVNSLIISVSVGFIGSTISFFTAYLTARINGVLSKLLHLSAMVSLAVPGIVLGLSYSLLFHSSWIYGTLTILILVNTIHFFSSPYLMIYNSMKKLNGNIESVGMTLGINRFYILKDVILPQTKNTLLEMFGYFFINCMMTISAVSFLSTLGNKPLALMITQFESQMMIECTAFISLLILCTNLLLKGIIYCLKQKNCNKERSRYVNKKTI